MCLIGHGAFGIITKAAWCNYLAVVGIGQDLAYQLMPLIGMFDIALGLSLLFFPTRAVALWLVCWGLLTAAMRPLSGEPFAELLERAGNFGAPLALLMLLPKATNLKGWFAKIQAPKNVERDDLEKVILCLRIIASIFLLGHGLLNLIGKKGLLMQYEALGSNNPQLVSYILGTIEIAGAAIFLAKRPLPAFVLFFFIWKVSTEIFYPQWVIWEWIERGGSYGTLLALWIALRSGRQKMSEKLKFS
jgi:hypothetical protein